MSTVAYRKDMQISQREHNLLKAIFVHRMHGNPEALRQRGA